MENQKINIAFLGNHGTGKTTLSKFVQQKYGNVILSFANPVKDFTASVLQSLHGRGFDYWRSLLNTSKAKDDPIHIIDNEAGFNEIHYPHGLRPMLQAIGQSARTVFGDDFWINQLQSEIDCYGTSSGLVIDDLRYGNEYDFLRFNNFHIVFIDKPGSDTGHDSESAQELVSTKQVEPDLVIKHSEGENNACTVLEAYISLKTDTNND